MDWHLQDYRLIGYLLGVNQGKLWTSHLFIFTAHLFLILLYQITSNALGSWFFHIGPFLEVCASSAWRHLFGDPVGTGTCSLTHLLKPKETACFLLFYAKLISANCGNPLQLQFMETIPIRNFYEIQGTIWAHSSI